MPYIGSAVAKTSDLKRITFATTTTGSGPFALGWEPDSEASLRVSINGVVQQGSDITISGSNLTISETLEDGDELEVVGIVHTGGQMVPLDGSVSLPKIARGGTSGQVLSSAGAGADAEWTSSGGAKMVSKTSTYAMSGDDFGGHTILIVKNDTSSAAYTVTLPLLTEWAGKMIIITHDVDSTGSNWLTLKDHATDGGASLMTSRAHSNNNFTVLSTGDTRVRGHTEWDDPSGP